MPKAVTSEPPLNAVIAGGGPAGAATAIHLARTGRRVLVVGLTDLFVEVQARCPAVPRRRPTYLHPPATALHEAHGHGTDPMRSTA
jgi:2-polyprenyl-6-methoxyphenol hydroxylase-like FAD-dependent oxidoreductase